MRLFVETPNKVFDFTLDCPITLVAGDSGVGKTYLLEYIRKSQSSGKFQNIVCIDRTSSRIISVLSILQQSKFAGKLIIIDNADILLDDGARDFIVQDFDNTYLIFGRDPRGLGMSVFTVAQLQEVDGRIGLEYLA